MVSRNEIVGVALLGFALLTKFRGSGDAGFIVSPSNFVRQATAQSSSIENDFDSPIVPMVNNNQERIGALTAERSGILQGLNNLIVPFFRRGFSFENSGQLVKARGFKFRTVAGSTGIFGFRAPTSASPLNSFFNQRILNNPRRVAVTQTIEFGQKRITSINEQLESL